MKKYRCHKTVEAARVLDIKDVSKLVRSHDFEVMVFDADGQSVLRVKSEVFARGRPDVGDYMVRYEDGYLSWSPKDVFEAGYRAV